MMKREEYRQTHEKIVELLFHIEGATFDFEVPTMTGNDYTLKYKRI